MMPGTTDRLLAQGMSCLQRGDNESALAHFDRLIAIEPGHAVAHLSRGLALKNGRRLEAALAAFDTALVAQPDYVPALVNRAAVLTQLGRGREALACCNRALTLQPEFAHAHCNRGLALMALDEPVEALESYDRAIAIDAQFAAAHGNRGKALQALNRPREALDAYRQVIALQPTAAQALVNAAHAHLLLGEFAAGWPLYEWRKRLATPLGNREIPKPCWNGTTSIAGKRLLLHWEQGLGDTIQFSRYARLALAGGADVTLMVQPGLRRLMRSLDPRITVTDVAPDPAQVDMHCPLLSLPQAFGTRLESVPGDTPYLHAEAAVTARWRACIGDAGFKLGINWQGNAESPADRGRSFPLHLFERISLLPQVRLISLHLGSGTAQMQALPAGMRVESPGEGFDAGPDAFIDTAALMEHLDLIISSDTATAHLAGALGRPAWLVLPQVPDWRWLMNRDDSPWYPSLRLFRQSRRGCWREPFDAMHAALSARLGPAQAIPAGSDQ